MMSAGFVMSGVKDACVSAAKAVEEAQKSHGKKEGTSGGECAIVKTDKEVFLTDPRCEKKILRDIVKFAKSLPRTTFTKRTFTREEKDRLDVFLYAIEGYHAIVDIAKKATDAVKKSLKAYSF